MKKKLDAVVVGSGPNGLAAAITLARAGLSVCVVEQSHHPGGGTRSAELTLPGYIHDICSAAHPMAIASHFFKSVPLEKFGLRWIESPVVLAHPLGPSENLPEGEAAFLYRSVEKTAAQFGQHEKRYIQLFQPFVEAWQELSQEIMAPMLHFPKHLFLLGRFGLKALQSAETFGRRSLRDPKASALFTGIAAHSNTPLHLAGTASIGLALTLAGHTGGWPIPEGGSQKIADALIAYFQSLGGEIRLNHPIRNWKDLPDCRLKFFDLTPKQILEICGERLSKSYAARLSRFRYGPGVFKMDWAVSRPIPWSNPQCAQAATVHLGGLTSEIVESEKAPLENRFSQKPYVLLVQPSLFDPSRAPDSNHTVWAYCHVPNRSKVDMSAFIEGQIERFAPGFQSTILARSLLNPAGLEVLNPNLVGGDIAGGLSNLKQILFRPTLSISPYQTSDPEVFICSSSTPPGPGVHGMCGYLAAQWALKTKVKAKA